MKLIKLALTSTLLVCGISAYAATTAPKGPVCSTVATNTSQQICTQICAKQSFKAHWIETSSKGPLGTCNCCAPYPASNN